MKKKILCAHATLVMLLLCCFNLGFGQNGHNAELFNNGWGFHKGDIDTSTIKLDKVDWRSVELPHDWSIEGPFSQEWASGTGFAPGGIGWYRKQFKLVPIPGHKNFIYFDGVYDNSEVWINGHNLGKRPSGFISFEYELTPYLKTSGDNELLVRVDHSKFADSRWYTGSGIYRNVYMITTNNIHIGLWGVAFTTPTVTPSSAAVEVNVAVVNSNTTAANLTVACRLIDPSGQQAGSASQMIKAGKRDTAVSKLTFKVRDPRLWSVDKPERYRLVVDIIQGGKVLDEWQEKVGVRNIRFDANQGFFLNGKNMKLKGVCIHDDAGVLGVAVPKEVWVRRLKIMQSAGVNSVRMGHNPHADYLYDLCDEMGILVMDENFDEWEGGKSKWIAGWNQGKPGKDGYHEDFKDWGLRDISDMVRRDRNHPSIIMWSIGNEIDYPGDPYGDPARKPSPEHPSAARLGEVSKALVAAIKKYDQSRPVTAALAGVAMSNKTDYPGNLDIVGYNYQESRYDNDHRDYPNRVIYGSENSKKLDAWIAVEKHDFIAGQYLWTGIDYLGEAHKWPDHGSSNGLVDMAGFPKAEFYFRQSLWLDTPMVRIAVADIPEAGKPDPYPKQGQPNWNFAQGDRKRINCFTNCPEAELFLNGVSLGRKKRSDYPGRVISWDLDYQPGKLEVKGYAEKGKVLTHTLMTSKDAYAIKASTDKAAMDQHTDLVHVSVNIVDKDGLPVFNADNPVTVIIDGPARLLGLENGALNNMDDHLTSTKQVLNGKLLAYVQRRPGSGTVKITLQSPGLRAQTLIVNNNGGK